MTLRSFLSLPFKVMANLAAGVGLVIIAVVTACYAIAILIDGER